MNRALLLPAALLIVSSFSALEAASAMPTLPPYECTFPTLQEDLSYGTVAPLAKLIAPGITGNVTFDLSDLDRFSAMIEYKGRNGLLRTELVTLPPVHKSLGERFCLINLKATALVQRQLSSALDWLYEELDLSQPNLNTTLRRALQISIIKYLQSAYDSTCCGHEYLLYIALHDYYEHRERVSSPEFRPLSATASGCGAGSPDDTISTGRVSAPPRVGSPDKPAGYSIGVPGLADASPDWRAPRARAGTAEQWPREHRSGSTTSWR